MRWSCPHCKVSQSIPDERVEGGWSFARCYKCNGYSLVRKSDVKTFKVAQPPEQATVLNSHPSEVPLMSREATNHLQLTLKNAAIRSENFQELAKSLQNQEVNQTNEGPKKAISERMLPYAIGLAGALALFSGAYLFMEGQSLWNKAHHASREADPIPVEPSIAAPIKDELKEAAMAPVREPVQESAQVPETVFKPEVIYRSIVIKPLADRVNLRTEPNVQAGISGTATRSDRFTVHQWKSDWFEVSNVKFPDKKYWIRNDFVSVAENE